MIVVTSNALRAKDFFEEAPAEDAPADWKLNLIK